MSQLPQRKQIRLRFVDYAVSNSYYVTICSFQKKCIFSQIEKDKVILSPLGNIIREEWEKTGEVREGILIEDYVIMPNHIHGILTFLDGKNPNEISSILQPLRSFGGSEQNSLSVIIGQIKSIVTKRAQKELGIEQVWQRGFYDHIIRNEKDMIRIKDYIWTNPINWYFDHENPEAESRR